MKNQKSKIAWTDNEIEILKDNEYTEINKDEAQMLLNTRVNWSKREST